MCDAYPDPAAIQDARERLAAPHRISRKDLESARWVKRPGSTAAFTDIPFRGESVPGGAPAIDTGGTPNGFGNREADENADLYHDLVAGGMSTQDAAMLVDSGIMTELQFHQHHPVQDEDWDGYERIIEAGVLAHERRFG